MVEVRKVQKPINKTSLEPYIRIPNEMGIKAGDIIKLEKINDKEIKLTKIT